MSDDDVEFGPIDFLVVEFPQIGMNGEGLPLLADLVDRGIIRILDLVFLAKAQDGSVVVVDVADFDANGELDLAVFAGAGSDLLGVDDVAEAGALLEPGSWEPSWSTRTAGPRRSPPPCAATARGWSAPGASRWPIWPTPSRPWRLAAEPARSPADPFE